MLDLNQTKDAHINERLQTEPIIWLSSVRPDGRPHLVPVWFLWDNGMILIFSQPNNQKIRNLQHNNNVMLSLEALDGGGDIVMIEGKAELIHNTNLQATVPAYAKKYATEIQGMGTTIESMASNFSQGIRITPTRFIAWGE